MWRKIFSFILSRWEYFIAGIFISKVKPDPSQEYVLLVDQARREWHWANNFIQEVKGENLVDQAIYCQSAAERKYVYLLKQAAREGIKADFPTIVSLALAAHNKGNWGVRACYKRTGKFY